MAIHLPFFFLLLCCIFFLSISWDSEWKNFPSLSLCQGPTPAPISLLIHTHYLTPCTLHAALRHRTDGKRRLREPQAQPAQGHSARLTSASEPGDVHTAGGPGGQMPLHLCPHVRGCPLQLMPQARGCLLLTEA